MLKEVPKEVTVVVDKYMVCALCVCVCVRARAPACAPMCVCVSAFVHVVHVKCTVYSLCVCLAVAVAVCLSESLRLSLRLCMYLRLCLMSVRLQYIGPSGQEDRLKAQPRQPGEGEGGGAGRAPPVPRSRCLPLLDSEAIRPCRPCRHIDRPTGKLRAGWQAGAVVP